MRKNKNPDPNQENLSHDEILLGFYNLKIFQLAKNIKGTINSMCFERFCEHHFLGGKNTHPHKEYILAKIKDKVSNLWNFL